MKHLLIISLLLASQTSMAEDLSPCQLSLAFGAQDFEAKDIEVISSEKALSIVEGLVEGKEEVATAIQDNPSAKGFRQGHFLWIGVEKDTSCELLTAVFTD